MGKDLNKEDKGVVVSYEYSRNKKFFYSKIDFELSKNS